MEEVGELAVARKETHESDPEFADVLAWLTTIAGGGT